MNRRSLKLAYVIGAVVSAATLSVAAPAQGLSLSAATTAAQSNVITYTAVGNDGGEWTTTSVALTFSAGIQAQGQADKLTAANIVGFNDGGTGATIGAVNGRGNGWSFDLVGVTKSGTISFSIAKDGFTIDPTVKHLAVVYSTSTPGTWPTVNITPRAEDASRFVELSAGTFSASDPGSATKTVTLTKGFAMGTTEVTQAQFDELMGADKSQQRGATLPVTDVTWYDAVEFCNRLSIQAGFDPAYTIVKTPQDALNTNSRDTYKFSVTLDETKNGYRLPTLAEWEYAERAGTQSLYFTGDTESTLQGYANLADVTYSQAYNDTAEVTLSVNDGFADIAPVASFAPNAWGLYDMIGNVAEWTQDWSQTYSASDYPLTDPTGLTADVPHSDKVARGGSYNNQGSFLTSTAAARAFPASSANGTVGFRVVRTIIPAPVNTAAPSISGNAVVGQTLTTNSGSWDTANLSFAFQWKRDGVNIAEATSATYTLTKADQGKAITVAATATGEGGSTTATSTSATVAYTSTLSLVLSSPVALSKSTVTATVQLTTSATGLAGKTVAVHIGSKTVTDTLDSQGKAKVVLPKQSRGLYWVTAEFTGDSAISGSKSISRILVVVF